MRRLTKCLILSLSLVVAQGADKEKAKFAPKPLAEYTHKLSMDKVTIAAEAFESDAQAREAFGKLNPTEYGILPVLVLMKNDGDKVLRLDRLKVEYVLPNRDRIEATPAADVPYTRAPKQPKVYSPVPRIPGIGKGGKNPLQAWEIEGRSFTAKMLPPGESAHGFFYFQSGSRSGAVLYLTGVYEAGSGKELFYFEIPLD